VSTLQTKRFWYSTPDLTDWRPTAGFGSDEWCNPSVYAYLPLLGGVTIFYGRHIDRSLWWMSGGHGGADGTWTINYISPDYNTMATVEFDHDILDDPCPHTKTDEWIKANASALETFDNE
jgi:hypothetical protein